MSTKTKSKRWNVVAVADGVQVKFVVRGDTKEIAETNAFNNYKGVTEVISLLERDIMATYPTSEAALKREAYSFEMRKPPSRRPPKRHNRKKLHG